MQVAKPRSMRNRIANNAVFGLTTSLRRLVLTGCPIALLVSQTGCSDAPHVDLSKQATTESVAQSLEAAPSLCSSTTNPELAVALSRGVEEAIAESTWFGHEISLAFYDRLSDTTCGSNEHKVFASASTVKAI